MTDQPITVQDLNDAIESFGDEAEAARDFDNADAERISNEQADRFAALRDLVQEGGDPLGVLALLGFKVDAGLIFQVLRDLELRGDAVEHGRGGVDSWLIRHPALEPEDSALEDGFEYSEVTVTDATDACDVEDLRALFVEPGSETVSDPWQVQA